MLNLTCMKCDSPLPAATLNDSALASVDVKMGVLYL